MGFEALRGATLSCSPADTASMFGIPAMGRAGIGRLCPALDRRLNPGVAPHVLRSVSSRPRDPTDRHAVALHRLDDRLGMH